MPRNYSVFPSVQKLLFSPQCMGCGRPLKPSSGICVACLRQLINAKSDNSAYLLEFTGGVHGLFHGLRGTAPLSSSSCLLRLLENSSLLDQWKAKEFDLVLAAPQRAKEGLSGLELVAEGIAGLVGARFVSSILKKAEERSQHGRSFASRVDTDCFVTFAGELDQVFDKNILVIDDVLTTGTTLDLSAYVLRKAGAKSVTVFALAHQMMPSLKRKSQEAHEEGGEVNPFLLHLGV